MTNKTKIAVDVFNKYAESYQDKYMDVSLYGDTFAIFCDALKQEQSKVLELACGPGNITRELLQLRPDVSIHATDLAPNMIALTQKNNPTATVQLLDIKALQTVTQRYDGIMCGFGLPYLSKQEAIQLIQNAAAILHTKGILYLSTMEDRYSKSGWEKGSSGEAVYMHYHEEEYLTDALSKAGFMLLHTCRKVYHTTQGNPVTDLILIAKKQADTAKNL